MLLARRRFLGAPEGARLRFPLRGPSSADLRGVVDGFGALTRDFDSHTVGGIYCSLSPCHPPAPNFNVAWGAVGETFFEDDWC